MTAAARCPVPSPRRRRLLLAACGAGMLPCRAQPSLSTLPTADEVKAAYLYKFLGYIEWPADAVAGREAAFVVGVAGSDAVHDALLRSAAARPHGRPLTVQRYGRPDAAAAASHVVFVGRGAWADLPAWVALAKGRGLVVVTDAPQGTRLGAALTFQQSDDRVRFEASLPAIEQAGVRVSSRLLAVAERVVGANP